VFEQISILELHLYLAVGQKQPATLWETMNLPQTLQEQGHEAEYRSVSGAMNMNVRIYTSTQYVFAMKCFVK
jgi:hypothetical protein